MSDAVAVSVDRFRMEFGSATVIRDLSFEVAAGETFGFLGSNGSGKTTTIRALLGIYPPTSGRLLIGYGVTTHAESFAGPLLDRVAAGTGRGVTIDIRASGLLPARNAVAHIGPNGSHTYDLVIFAPCYLEASFAPGAGIPRHGATIQQHLLDTGSPSLLVVMLGIPQPNPATPLDTAAAAAAATTNRALQDRAGSSARVQYLRPADFTSVLDPHPFTAAYYRTVGHQLADLIVPSIGHPGPR